MRLKKKEAEKSEERDKRDLDAELLNSLKLEKPSPFKFFPSDRDGRIFTLNGTFSTAENGAFGIDFFFQIFLCFCRLLFLSGL